MSGPYLVLKAGDMHGKGQHDLCNGYGCTSLVSHLELTGPNINDGLRLLPRSRTNGLSSVPVSCSTISGEQQHGWTLIRI